LHSELFIFESIDSDPIDFAIDFLSMPTGEN
jgi:hypothetical protein